MKVSLKQLIQSNYYGQSNSKNQRPKTETAVVGVGSFGQHHARNFAELSTEGKGEFVGVCDVDEENAKTCRKKQLRIFCRWRNLLDKVDAVFNR